jgi:hypothetical protein
MPAGPRGDGHGEPAREGQARADVGRGTAVGDASRPQLVESRVEQQPGATVSLLARADSA